MVLVKASETSFRFPVQAFVSRGETTGFPDIWCLLTHHAWCFRDNIYPGMELVDAKGRHWITRRAYPVTRQVERRWWHTGPLKPRSWTELELEIEEVEPLSLPELIDRICLSEAETRRIWWERHHDPKKQESEEDFQERLTQLRAAKDMDQIYDIQGYAFEPGFWWGRL